MQFAFFHCIKSMGVKILNTVRSKITGMHHIDVRMEKDRIRPAPVMITTLPANSCSIGMNPHAG